jgi:predicted DsbA family dithiol-disulfide isomerase
MSKKPQSAASHPAEPTPAKPMQQVAIRVDVVSDVTCPWCAIGLASLDQAIERVKGEAWVHVHLQPFELNPHMGPEGQDVTEHLSAKYGSTPEQQAQGRERIRQRGLEVGFVFRPEGRGRVWNTFNAHRLLQWAGDVDARANPPHSSGHQLALKGALLAAVHTRGESPADVGVLLEGVRSARLDPSQASAILDSDAWSTEVRDAQRFYLENGINAVPAFIFNEEHLVSGGQPVELLEQVLRQLIAQAQAPTETDTANDSTRPAA